MAYENIYLHDSMHPILIIHHSGCEEKCDRKLYSAYCGGLEEYAGETKIMVVKGTVDISNLARHKPGCITRWINA